MENDACKAVHQLEGASGYNNNLFEGRKITRIWRGKKKKEPVGTVTAQEV